MSDNIADSEARFTHAQALNLLNAVDIRVHSSGNCSDKNNKRCTSLDGVRQSTIYSVIAFKQASNCEIVITAGTEVGHASGTYSHANGYKLDIRMAQSVTTSFRLTLHIWVFVHSTRLLNMTMVKEIFTPRNCIQAEITAIGILPIQRKNRCKKAISAATLAKHAGRF